ncbi:undecaprenyl-diphosphate phosphatase [Chryseolinea soli]|uniref:Undecaprenyl-diphosphatase n=1 Tax=Chryseolinea soli TaxID=2321403 RepID=A0A385SV65_9BACT|nr:undecaprenyl-diphosphate phosphatase [Chryseolinea soli]AYB34047.1 undecaprenyl-diphosphate phosphatase [Chryseolinea soli]
MSIFHAILLAIIEGLTEFLPVSSTGHMIIGSSLMGIASDPFTKMFTVAIQLGAILSVLVLYWRRFFPKGKTLKELLPFYLKLLVAFIPAGVLGLLLNDYIDALLERVDVVGYMLVIGGVFFLFVDNIFRESENAPDREITFPTAWKIGFFQIISLVPGVSRSAATIIGGLAQKLNKKSAAEFSFFLAVPTMFAATGYKILKFYTAGGVFGSHEITLLAVGNIVAFIVAILAIKSFVTFLTRHGFKLFGYYRIAVGTLILILYYLGVGLTIV